MAKLTLQPNPSFKAEVLISVPGAKAVPVEFTFKYRNRDELQKFIARVAASEQIGPAEILEMCTAWELTDPFDAASLETLALNYLTAPRSIFEVYIDEHTKAGRKN